MKFIYLTDNTVQEIIPETNPAFPGIPIEQRYSPEFLANCVVVDNNTEVQSGWIYDPETQTFSEPPEPEPVEPIDPPDREPPEPTEMERTRADIDYLALMMGVEL